MAAVALSFKQDVTPVAIGKEVFRVDMDVDTSVTITPSKIRAIESVYCTAMNAAAQATVPQLTSFTLGSPTVTITAGATGIYLVVIEGTVA